MVQLTREEDLDDLEQMALIDMSYSRFDTFMTCQAKYFYTYIAKEPRVFGPAAALGNIVHEVLELSLGEGELDLAELLKLTRETRPKYDPEGEIPTDLLDVGAEIVEEFYERHEIDPYFISEDHVIAKEMAFSIIIGTARVRGYIDFVYRDKNGNVSVIDFKSGKYEVKNDDVPGNLQLGLYALAVAQEFPDQDVYPAELYYLRSGRRKKHEFTREDLQVVHDEVIEQMQIMLNRVVRGFSCTDQAFVCRYLCDFGKNGTCNKGKYIVDNWNK